MYYVRYQKLSLGHIESATHINNAISRVEESSLQHLKQEIKTKEQPKTDFSPSSKMCIMRHDAVLEAWCVLLSLSVT